MRIAVGLLACLGVVALTSALADPPAENAAAATATPAPSSPAPAASGKAELDKDTQHFLAEGYKPEMHGGEQLYCRKETALGSRLAPVKSCGTIEQLKLAEQRTKQGVSDAQRQQTNPTYH
jgi:hypothetical protein